MRPSILIVDDEAGVRSALSGVLRDEGFEVEAVPTGEACLEIAPGRHFDVILLDVWLPGIDGLLTLSRLRDHCHQPSTWRGHGSQYMRSLQNQSASFPTGGINGPTSDRL